MSNIKYNHYVIIAVLVDKLQPCLCKYNLSVTFKVTLRIFKELWTFWDHKCYGIQRRSSQPKWAIIVTNAAVFKAVRAYLPTLRWFISWAGCLTDDEAVIYHRQQADHQSSPPKMMMMMMRGLCIWGWMFAGGFVGESRACFISDVYEKESAPYASVHPQLDLFTNTETLIFLKEGWSLNPDKWITPL